MMINMAVGQTATPLAAVSRAAYAAADFFSIIDAPKPSTIGKY
jgi:ATP-binding cassette subfamily B (MDR/TAP) protein 1